MGEYLNIHLRWNPDNKAHAEALKYLNKLHESGFGSINGIIVDALIAYGKQQEGSAAFSGLTDGFAQKVAEKTAQILMSMEALPVKPAEEKREEEINKDNWDFLGFDAE